MFKEERDECQFAWSMMGDIEKGRPNLGPTMHVAVYRLMQFTLRDILIRDFGVEKADKIIFEAGKTDVRTLLYPILLLVSGVFVVIGLGIYLRISIIPEKQERKAAHSGEEGMTAKQTS